MFVSLLRRRSNETENVSKAISLRLGCSVFEELWFRWLRVLGDVLQVDAGDFPGYGGRFFQNHRRASCQDTKNDQSSCPNTQSPLDWPETSPGFTSPKQTKATSKNSFIVPCSSNIHFQRICLRGPLDHLLHVVVTDLGGLVCVKQPTASRLVKPSKKRETMCKQKHRAFRVENRRTEQVSDLPADETVPTVL